MSLTRRIAAAAAVATIGVLSFAASANAAVTDGATTKGATKWYAVDHEGNLLAVQNNNVGPFQACNNQVPVNVIGGQVPVQDLTALIGVASDGNSATVVNPCSQNTAQNNGGDKGGYGSRHAARTDARYYKATHHGNLVEVSGNNVGPFQACGNQVPVNVLGIQVPLQGVSGLLGIASDGNSSTVLSGCSQNTAQNNGNSH